MAGRAGSKQWERRATRIYDGQAMPDRSCRDQCGPLGSKVWTIDVKFHSFAPFHQAMKVADSVKVFAFSRQSR
jgi:hypothetical protein